MSDKFVIEIEDSSSGAAPRGAGRSESVGPGDLLKTMLDAVKDMAGSGGGGGGGAGSGLPSWLRNTNTYADEMKKQMERERREAEKEERERTQLMLSRIGTAQMLAQSAGVPGASALGNIASGAAAGAPGGAAAAAGLEIAKSVATAIRTTFVDAQRNAMAYSGEAAQAGAMADVRSTLQDLKEGQAMGESIAKFTSAQSDLENTVRELLLPIKKVVVEMIADGMRLIADTLQGVIDATVASIVVLDTIVILVNDLFGTGKIADIPDLLKKINERINDAIKKANAKDDAADVDPFLDQFLKMDIGGANQPVPQMNAGARGGLGVFGGF